MKTIYKVLIAAAAFLLIPTYVFAVVPVTQIINGGTGINTLSAGRIPFGNGTSPLGSSASLFWDNTNSRLGIGTATPATLTSIGGNLFVGAPTAGGTVGRLGVGVASPAYPIDVAGFVNVDQYSGFKINGTTNLFATSTGNLFVGANAGQLIDNTVSTRLYNTAIGFQSMQNASSTTNSVTNWNTAVGALTLQGTKGSRNTAIGYNSLNLDYTGNDNTAIGYNTLAANVTGNTSVAIGASVLANVNGTNDLVAVGNGALTSLTSGASNVAVGYQSNAGNLTSTDNTSFGASTNRVTTGAYNTAIGSEAGYGGGGATYTQATLTGYRAGFALTSGNGSTLFGYTAGRQITTGIRNTCIGNAACQNATTGGTNIVIGYNANVVDNTANEQLNIGSAIFGVLVTADSSTADADARIGVGSTSPNARLVVENVSAKPSFEVDDQAFDATPFFIDTAGAVGISTTSPQDKLQIDAGAIRFGFLSPAGAATTALAGLGAGNVPNGTYVYKVQFITANGDGFTGATSSPITVTDNTTNGQVALTNLPISVDPAVTSRRLWRSANNGASWLAFNVGSQAASIANNTVTTFTDNIAAPSDNFGALPSDAFDSGYIKGNANKGYSISALGNSIITGNLAVNGGRVTDNNGTVSLGLNLGTNKCGLYITDNFNQDCGTAYLGIAQSNGSKTGLRVAKASNTVSNDKDASGTGWLVTNTYGNTASGNSGVGYGTLITTTNVVNTGTTVSYLSKNYLQGGNLTNFIGFYSYGQNATANSTVINQYDFRADDFNSASTQGTTTNRYGLYLNETKGARDLLGYGVYQVSNTLQNFFNGNVGVGTTTPNGALLDIAGNTATSSLLIEPSSSDPTTAYVGSVINSATQNVMKIWEGFWKSLAGNMFTATADSVINTTGATTGLGTGIGTKTIPANYLKAGKHFTIWGVGYYSTPIGNVSTVTLAVKYGSVTLATVTTAALPSSATNLPFNFREDCTVRTTGATGTVVCNGTFDYSTALSGVVKTSNDLSSVGTVTIDTTAASALDVTGLWSAVTTQTATVQQSSIDWSN